MLVVVEQEFAIAGRADGHKRDMVEGQRVRIHFLDVVRFVCRGVVVIAPDVRVVRVLDGEKGIDHAGACGAEVGLLVDDRSVVDRRVGAQIERERRPGRPDRKKRENERRHQPRENPFHVPPLQRVVRRLIRARPTLCPVQYRQIPSRVSDFVA